MTVVAGRQISAHFLNLPLNEVEIVNQPLRRRRDGSASANGTYGRPEGATKYLLIFGQPRSHCTAAGRPNFLNLRQAPRMFFQPLNAEELGANRLRIVPK